MEVGWTAIDSSNLYQYTRIDLSTGSFIGQNGCDNGVHTATSAGPFTITAWGWGNTQTNNRAVRLRPPFGNVIAYVHVPMKRAVQLSVHVHGPLIDGEMYLGGSGPCDANEQSP